MKEWTIDTWVLYEAGGFNYEALELLFLVGRMHKVAFDYEGHIAGEYNRCLQRCRNPLLGKWLENLKRRKAAVFYSGKLHHRHEQALLRMKFDHSDFPFVAVASRSKDKLLVSEDSYYTDKVCESLRRELRVQVLKVHQASNLATHDP